MAHLNIFYSKLHHLEQFLGDKRLLENCARQVRWPKRGVYFFFEPGERRTDTGEGLRVVRVGTHAIGSGQGTKLWTRLSQHRGQIGCGGGNHRGSIFRLIVGTALIERDGHDCVSWGSSNVAPREVREGELALECAVSRVIRAMPFLWLAVDDEPGPQSLRGYIERNAIALLSNFGKPALDPASATWLGRLCNRERVRKSGLWNSNHVEESYDAAFLDCFERVIGAMEATT